MGASSSTTRRRSTSDISAPLRSPPGFLRTVVPRQSSPASPARCKMIRMSDFPLIVDPGWVQAHPDARLVDLRWSPSKAPATGNLPNAPPPPALRKYEEGHLPGAVFVDLDRDLSSPGGPGRHPFPTGQQFAQVLSRLGIGPETHVVVYDEGHSSVAARLWFMLRAFGHERASVLDGGMRAWTEAGLPLSKETPRIPPAPLRALRLDRSR